MRVHLSDAGTITLREPANFRGLDVLIDPQPRDRADRLIARIGRREGEDYIRLSPDVLRFLSPLAGDADWEEGFAAMIAYASKAGWVDETGAVRAHITAGDAPGHVGTDDFRGAMRRLAAGVCAITTGTMEAPLGMVASSVVSVSAEPPLIGVFVNETSSSLVPLLAAGQFAANVLGHAHGPLVQRFVREPQGVARFADAEWSAGQVGLPVLGDALAVAECAILSDQTIGTHRLVIGRVLASRTRDARPMVHFDGGALRLAEETA